MNRPSPKQVEMYLRRWDTLENYTLQESSLKKLFTITYPVNNELDEVLIKVCALNDFYSTSIYYPVPVAKHILSMNLDMGLAKSDLSIVNKIANVEVKADKTINYYSFATKYCSHHKPKTYPIYDSFVDKFLVACKKVDEFYSFANSDLRIFEKYCDILENFKKFYGLEEFDLKQIDKYLWQVGKETFPRNYKKK